MAKDFEGKKRLSAKESFPGMTLAGCSTLTQTILCHHTFFVPSSHSRGIFCRGSQKDARRLVQYDGFTIKRCGYEQSISASGTSNHIKESIKACGVTQGSSKQEKTIEIDCTSVHSM
jgi:hypothetical protein